MQSTFRLSTLCLVLMAVCSAQTAARYEGGRRLLDSEKHVVLVSRDRDEVVFVMEAINDFTNDRDSSQPLGTGWDYAGIRVDVNNNNVVDERLDLAFGTRQKTNIFCPQYLIHEMASTGCGVYRSKGRVQVEFAPTSLQERPHPVFTYRIPFAELNSGGGLIGLVFVFGEPKEGQSTYPNRRSPYSFRETIQLDLSEL